MASNEEVVQKMKDKENWYGHAADYWQQVDPSVNGMLQGFEKISDVDCDGSQNFIKYLQKEKNIPAKCHKAADCGAGIGRVSKHFLLKVFDKVDVVEQCENFTKNVHNYMGDEELSNRIENIFNVGLQEFDPEEGHYDVIWLQWVVGHLTDEDFINFLKRCKKGLAPGGFIGIKDNVTSGEAVYDSQDSSVTRTHKEFQDIFNAGGVNLETWVTQKGFPNGLFSVNMYALL